jgi:hypothetical protein
MVMGYDDRDGFSIYYVDNEGVRSKGKRFAVGSGSTYAYRCVVWRSGVGTCTFLPFLYLLA